MDDQEFFYVLVDLSDFNKGGTPYYCSIFHLKDPTVYYSADIFSIDDPHIQAFKTEADAKKIAKRLRDEGRHFVVKKVHRDFLDIAAIPD